MLKVEVVEGVLMVLLLLVLETEVFLDKREMHGPRCTLRHRRAFLITLPTLMFKLVLRYASLQRKPRTCIACARSPTAAHRLLRFCHAVGGIDDKEALEEVETCPFDPFA
jgi:hypothetical protein